MSKITASKVIKIAEKYLGYLEKKNKTAKYLTDNKSNFTANAGDNNYTLFGNWYGKQKGIGNPNPWCAFYISYIFYKATEDLEYTKELLCGDIFSYCPTGVNQFRKKKQFYTSDPQKGDIIFFTNGKRSNHVGLVVDVDKTRVYTIEGNTSSKSGVIENGEAVAKKSYSLTYNKILGYGRPTYQVDKVENTYNTTTPHDIVYDYHKVVKGDTLSKIAVKYNTDIDTLLKNNEMKNSNLIYVGQNLLVSEKRVYTVRAGDTLSKISNKMFGTSKRYKEIIELNKLKSTTISIGQKLVIPQ